MTSERLPPRPTTAPFFIVNGASGSGKSYIVGWLRQSRPGLIVFDLDTMTGDNWQVKKANWLRVAHSIGLSGVPRALCGMGYAPR
ncbi:MAG: hypothetical protein AB7H71_02770 [Alphaproteobacteria bacterium]